MIKKQTITVVILFLIMGYTGLSVCSPVHADDLNAGIILADDQERILYSQNSQKQFIPASILKILTSLAALQILGEEYRYPTKYYFNTITKDLYIKGFGDPVFTSETIEQFCSDIMIKTKIKFIRHIILDQTYFSDQIRIPGKANSLNPYDASICALCANFNTIKFKWDKKKNRYISGELQTPLLPNFYEDIKKSNLKQGRIILSRQQSLLYPGLLIKHFLEKKKITVTGSVVQGIFDADKMEIRTFRSPLKIEKIVQKLLKYSNNYIANLLLLTMGAKELGPPSTLEKGIRSVKRFAKQQLELDTFTLLEGSGLSRSNLVSPDQMSKVLIKFMPFFSLLNNKGNDFYKTGTLTGVRTRAGYIVGKDNRLYPYVIMVNQKNKGVEAIRKNLLNLVLKKTKNPK